MAQPASREFLWGMFQKVDTDRSQKITANELGQALQNGSFTPFNPETIRLMIGMFDRDGDNTINFDEFGSLWNYVSQWQNTFRTYDKDGSGTIDKNELTTGYRLSPNFYEVLIRKFDRTGRGSITFDDFIQCCVVIQTLTGNFQRFDTNRNGWIQITYEQFLTLVFSLKK